MQLETKKYIVIIVILWIISILASLYWNLSQSCKTTEAAHLKTAKAFVQQVLIARAWNATHGGVYLRVSNSLQPNPYLQVPDRDLETSKGIRLTLVNPAYMTRMISEIAQQQGKIQFRLTSLKPLNPDNDPTPWEHTALQEFENRKLPDYFFYQREKNTEFFSYIAPIVTKKTCLKCHGKQGYSIGDIRGGISVTFPIKRKAAGPLIFSHLLFLVAGTLLIAGFGRKIVRLTDNLKKQSHMDGLTQIANRIFFDETLHREWLRSRRLHTSLSLIMCDIDHFKRYNDTYGHQAGDTCLKQVTKALDTLVNRPADLVARYGGEEFVVVLPETSAEGARIIAELIQTTVEKLRIPHSSSKTASYVTISLGVATMTSHVIPEKELIERADKALYSSKKNGRNIYTHADEL